MALRRWMMLGTATLVASAMGVAACGGDDSAGAGSSSDAGSGNDATQPGDDGSSGKDSGNPITDAGADADTAELAACQSVWSSICSTYTKCGLPSWFCGPGPQDCPGSLFDGGGTFTVAQANACAAALTTVTCDDLETLAIGPEGNGNILPLSSIAACNVPGTRGAGDSCEFSAQCASLLCTSPESDFFALNQAGSTGQTGACGTCAPIFGPNDDCSGGIIIGPPAPIGVGPTTPVCPPGTACDSVSRRCRTANPGDPCIGSYCAFGAFCENNPDGGAPFCAKVPKVGEACTEATPCADSYCKFAGSGHDDGGTCLPKVAAGGDCSPSLFGTVLCADGTECDPVDGGPTSACTTLATEGQPCDVVDCANGLYCDNRNPDAQKCRKLEPNGQPCGTFPQMYGDGGLTGFTTDVPCAGECSTSCGSLADGGPQGTCVSGTFGASTGETCGTAICATCNPGSSCVSGKCEPAALHCN